MKPFWQYWLSHAMPEALQLVQFVPQELHGPRPDNKVAKDRPTDA
jgi:hypothetical protein